MNNRLERAEKNRELVSVGTRVRIVEETLHDRIITTGVVTGILYSAGGRVESVEVTGVSVVSTLGVVDGKLTWSPAVEFARSLTASVLLIEIID